jgi:hypothetical protein
MVNGFAYKLDSMQLGGGARNIEIRYEAAGLTVHKVKGVTRAIK